MEGGAKGKTSVAVEVEEGMTTAEVVEAEARMRRGEVGEAEVRTRWGEAGEAAPLLLRRRRWSRRSTAIPSSQGASGNPGTD